MNLRLVFCTFAAVLLHKCGAIPTPKLDRDERIVGGHEVEIDDYPYQVSVLFYGLHTCGGVLLNGNKHVITAAHCVSGKSPSTLSVRAGSSIRNYGGVVEHVSQVAIMDLFNSTTLLNDVAVLNLAQPFPEASYIKSVELPVAGSQAATANVSGWGTIEEGGTPSTILRAVELEVYDNAKCKTHYPADLIQATMICAGIADGGKDACEGDSGGPLAYMDATDDSFNLVGLVSWGFGCGRKGYPGVYTDVTEATVNTFITTQLSHLK